MAFPHTNTFKALLGNLKWLYLNSNWVDTTQKFVLSSSECISLGKWSKSRFLNPPKDYSFFTYHSEWTHIKSYLMWILAFTIHACMKWIEKCAPCKHWQEAQSFRRKCEARYISAWFCCNKSNWLRPLSWFLPVKDQVNKWLFKSQHLKFLLMYVKQ